MNTWAHVKVLLSRLQRDSEPPTSDRMDILITGLLEQGLSDLSLRLLMGSSICLKLLACR
jgi:hypothetical protein